MLTTLLFIAEEAVVMSLDSYNNMMENLYLMSSPTNVKRLNESIDQVRAGHVVKQGLLGVEQKQPHD